MANARWACSALLLTIALPLLAAAQDAPGRGQAMYRGPHAYQDPRDPFQAVRWSVGLYVPERLRLKQAPFYARNLEYRPESDEISIGYTASEWIICPPVPFTHAGYAEFAFQEELRGQLKQTETNYSSKAHEKGLLNVKLPFQVPFTEKLFGEGAPNLSVRGSHRINVSGTSKWTVDAPTTQYGKQSIFPNLEMKQDLNVSLKGRIGTKLTLDIQQNSEAITPLENALKIRYTGEEDEVVKRVDLGNTSLSLPKTQNISFSTRQEGLFGVRADAKLGNVNITAIASRQEGQQGGASYSGSGERITKIIRDYSYEARRFFYLFDPARYGYNPANYPRINYASVEVLLDDKNQQNDVEAKLGNLVIPPNVDNPENKNPTEQGHFHQLILNDDYKLEPLYSNDPIVVLQLNTPLSQDHTLAMAYQETLSTGDVVWRGQAFTQNPEASEVTLMMLSPAWDVWGSQFVTDSDWSPVAPLELKNIYSIGRGVDMGSLELSIWRIGTDEYETQSYNGKQFRFIHLLEIDRLDNDELNVVEGGDGKIDPFVISGGLLFFPMERPFDYEKLDAEDGRSPEIYDREHTQLLREANKEFHKYEIRIEYQKPLNQISIGGFGGVLENSETVRLNGTVLERGTDYTVDWASGIIELRETPPADADIRVTWSEDSLLKQGATNLFGASIYQEGNQNYSWATSWLHKSEGLPEKRPRLGQESNKITLGDLSGSLTLRPWVFTDLVDALPGVTTNAASELRFTGSLGLSFPNPNTRQAVWAADMESAKLVTSAGINNRNWSYSSIPENPRITLPGGTDPVNVPLDHSGRGRLVWFSPATVDRGDLRPELDELEAREPQSVLEVIYIPTPEEVGTEYKWGGLVTSLSRTGVDLSEAQYLEVWINDFIPHGGDRRGELRIDIGTVSEDAVWDPLVPPAPANGSLDTEDTIFIDGVVSLDEDVGMDGLRSNSEELVPGNPNSTSGDPAFDDYDGISDESERVQVEDSLARKLQKMNRLNGTEGNTSLDTEDLDRDGIFDDNNHYLGFTIDLAEEAYIDVTRNLEDLGQLDRPEQNGWRAYRIPITDKQRQIVGAPLLNNVEHMRIWFRGVDVDNGGNPDTLNVQIASLSVVSNRWERQPILAGSEEVDEAELESLGAVYGVAVVNNKDDEELYSPPFPLERKNRITEREQSLSLEYEEFQPDHEFRATRFYPRAQDFTLYQDVRFYLNPRLQAPGDSLEFFVRFSSNTGKDTLDYYELATTVEYMDPRSDEDGWMEFQVPITSMSSLKAVLTAKSDSFVVGPEDRPSVEGGLKATVRGTPSFSQVRIMTVGLRNQSGTVIHTGRVWVDDIRMGDVRKDVGWTGNFGMTLRMADLMSLSARYSQKSEDFLRLDQQRGSGLATESFGFDTSFETHKFIEETGVRLPLKFSYTKNRSTPKFRANSDVEFTGVNSGKDITEDDRWSLGVNFSRQGRGRSSWLMRHTLDSVRINANMSGSTANKTTSIDTTSATNTSVSYTLVPTQKTIPLGRLRLSPLPKQISVNWNRSYNHRVVYTKDRFDPTIVNLTNNNTTRSARLDVGSNFNPVRPLTFGISSQRDLRDDNWQQPLLIEERPATTVFGINLGRETGRSYKLNYNFNPNLRIIHPRVTLATTYNQSTGASETAEDYDHVAKSISNNRSIRVNMTLPVTRFLESLQGRGGGSNTAPSSTTQSRAERDRKLNEERRKQIALAEERARERARAQAREDSLKTEGITTPEPATEGDEDQGEDGRDPAQEEVGDQTEDSPEEEETKEDRGGGFSIRPLLNLIHPRDVQLQIGSSRSTSVGNVYGSVDPLYQLGFSTDPGKELRSVNRISQSGDRTSLRRSSDSQDLSLNGNTGVTVFRKLNVDVKFAHSRTKSVANVYNTDIRSDTTWPDLVIRWERIQNELPLLGSLFTEFKTVSTNFSRKTTKRGTEDNPEESVTVATQFNPLFSVTGTLKGGWQMNTRVNTSSSVTKRPAANSEQVNKNFNVSTGFKRQFSRGPGKRSVDLDISLSYGRSPKTNKGFTTQKSGLETIQGGASAKIQITSAIPGTFGINFTQRKDLRTLRVDRSLGINFSTRVTF